ncbi:MULTISPECIES: type IV pilus assembly protein PilM [unclassified Vibrio]|uniref:type IV pilus assembly protein PilM n=1 Tax=unclassified Vibrio TaxID=2614977 RepID=UPI002F427D87
MGKSVVSGIDIGHHSIKVVVLKPYKGRYALVGYQELPIEAGIFSDNHMLNYQKIVKKLKELRKTLPRISRKVALTLADNSVISKVLQIDSATSRHEIEFALLDAFSSQSPFPVEELCLDYVELEEQNTDQFRLFQVFATKKGVVNNRIEVLRAAGMSPLLIDLRSHSLARVWQLAASQLGRNDWMLINIDRHLSTVCIDFPLHAPYCKDIHVGNEDEHKPTLSQCQFKAFAQGLVEKLKRQIQLIASIYNVNIQGIWLCGEAGQLSKLSKWLHIYLKLECQVLDPFELLEWSSCRVPRSELEGGAFAIATGAALRGVSWLESKSVV